MNSETITLFPIGGDASVPQTFAEGNVHLVSHWMGPIDTSLTHVVQGEFKAVGLAESVVYFGLDCASDLPVSDGAHDEKRVRDVDVCCNVQSEARVEEFDAKKGLIVVTKDTAAALKVWNQPNTSPDKRAIAFYFDGITNRKPDYVHLWQAKVRGGYHSTDAEAGLIFLQDPSQTAPNPLPAHVVERIVPNKTVVRQHFSSGTYLYLGPKGDKLEPGKWNLYTHKIKGEGLMNDPKKFRVGTKYVRVFILANYRQTQDETLLFRNIAFTQIRSYRFIKDGMPREKKLVGKDKIHKHRRDRDRDSDSECEKKRDAGGKESKSSESVSPSSPSPSSGGIQLVTSQVTYPYNDTTMAGVQMFVKGSTSNQKYEPVLRIAFSLSRPSTLEISGVFSYSTPSVVGMHAVLADSADQLVSQNSVYVPWGTRASWQTSDVGAKVHYPMTWMTKELPAGEHVLDMKLLVVGEGQIYINQSGMGDGLNNVMIKVLP